MPIEALADADLQHSHAGTHDATDTYHHGAEHAGMQHDSGSRSGLACNDCGVCHLACWPAVSALAPAVEPVGTESFMRSSPTLPPLFVPEPREPPPLLAVF
jgi:hypothetical protein